MDCQVVEENEKRRMEETERKNYFRQRAKSFPIRRKKEGKGVYRADNAAFIAEYRAQRPDLLS